MTRSNIKRFGFTLVELLIVIIVIAVLAAIAIPKFVNSSARSKEGSLHADLKLVRNAVEMFHNDTNTWPTALSDISSTVAPANGKDSTGAASPINASDFKGPYIAAVPYDPVSVTALTYSVTSPTVGQVSASATGNDSSGIAFSTY